MNLPALITSARAEPLPRGSRRASSAIPANMLAAFIASEARAWSHSPLAGALWEAGLRASRAIELAEIEERPP